jgi:MFS family permease
MTRGVSARVANQTVVRPVSREISRRQMNLVFGTVVLGMLLSALDQTIVSTAVPTIVGDLGGGGHLSWVVSSYLLADTIATVLAGKFGDLFGRKPRAASIGRSVRHRLGGMRFRRRDDVADCLAGGAGFRRGGLAVTATALIADVIPLRERGKYQGALGAVFGVTTVLGPLVGGLFTDHLSWRWAFYVNLPLGVVVVVLASFTIPRDKAVSRPIIDYLGIGLVSVGAAGLTLALSWGGTEYAWGSATIVGLFVGSATALALFVVAESRAVDPIRSCRCGFPAAGFSVSVVLAFIVGFAMLGAMTFLPTYFQYVRGVSATDSGVQTLPLVVGLLVTSIASGTLVGRTGRYKVFPVAGSFVMGVGLWLLSRMDAHTSFWLMASYMLVLGAGIGLIMQVLTIIVQNTVDYRDLGVATSGVTFFRTLGSSFGATDLDVANGWCVGAVHLRQRLDRVTSLAAIAQRMHVPAPVLQPAFEQARAAGYLTGTDDQLRLTEAGQREIDKFVAAMRVWLSTELRDWGAGDDQLLSDALTGIARTIVDEEPALGTPPPPRELAAAAPS